MLIFVNFTGIMSVLASFKGACTYSVKKKVAKYLGRIIINVLPFTISSFYPVVAIHRMTNHLAHFLHLIVGYGFYSANCKVI